MNSKINLRKISLKAYFKPFYIISVSESSADGCTDLIQNGHIDRRGKDQFIVGLPLCALRVVQ